MRPFLQWFQWFLLNTPFTGREKGARPQRLMSQSYQPPGSPLCLADGIPEEERVFLKDSHLGEGQFHMAAIGACAGF